MTTEAPLAGIRVVESTSIYSGPFAGLMLGELGAEVIKVESVAKPDLVRNRTGDQPLGVSPAFYSLNRGKRFVSVDASMPAGREVFVRLAASADVYVHNMRPGKENAIGASYEELSAKNPRLVYVAISGLGSSGVDSRLPVYDYVIQARVGMVDYQRDDNDKAALLSQVLVDKSAANAAVQATLAALLVRERTGRGQRIDISMLGVGLSFGWPDVMSYFLSELNPQFPYDMLPPYVQRAPSSALMVLRTQDGEIVVSPALPPFDGLAIAFDRPDWVTDDRFAGASARLFNVPALKAEMVEAASKFTTDELLARLAENDVAAGPVQKRGELHRDPLIASRLTEIEVEHLGTIRQPVPMWDFGDSHAIATTTMGRVGEHTRAVLGELGLSDTDMAALRAAGAIAWPEPELPPQPPAS